MSNYGEGRINYDGLHALKGKVVDHVERSRDGSSLVFYADEPLHFYVDGDCCSRSWFSGITGLDAILGAEITAVDDAAMPEPAWNEDDYEEIKFYGYRLRTMKGTCTVEFRNRSNGYYGGECQYTSSPLPDDRIPVTDDYDNADVTPSEPA